MRGARVLEAVAKPRERGVVPREREIDVYVSIDRGSYFLVHREAEGHIEGYFLEHR